MSKRMFRACNTVKLSRAWKRRPWKYMDPTPKSVKVAKVPPRYNPLDDFDAFVGRTGNYDPDQDAFSNVTGYDPGQDAEDINQITQRGKSTLYGESSPESRIHMVPLDEPTVVFTDVDGTQAFTSIDTSEGPVA